MDGNCGITLFIKELKLNGINFTDRVYANDVQLSFNMADSYIWKDQRILKLKPGKKCIISLRSFLKLDGICKIEFWTL